VLLASCISATRFLTYRLYSGRHSRSIPTTLSVMLALKASRAPACTLKRLGITDHRDKDLDIPKDFPEFRDDHKCQREVYSSVQIVAPMTNSSSSKS
jgi:hypothetical protein